MGSASLGAYVCIWIVLRRTWLFWSSNDDYFWISSNEGYFGLEESYLSSTVLTWIIQSVSYFP